MKRRRNPEAGTHLRLYARTGGLLLAMGAGAFCPSAQALSPSIPYLIVAMLFLSSLELPIGRSSFGMGVWKILAANILIAFIGYAVLFPLDHELALVAFITGITPTAVSAPVIMAFLEGRVDLVVASVLVTNTFMALMLPFVLPLVAGGAGTISTAGVLFPVLVVVLVPLGLSRAVPFLPAKARRILGRAKPLSFSLWLAALFLVTAKSSYFIINDMTVSPARILAIAGVALVICGVNFGVGAFLGGPLYRKEASQSLGQKNNSFTIWLALTFINPVVALGPTCYVIYHNVYNSMQLFAFERKRTRGENG